jgi:AcrR family transcriptional regulator
MSTETKTRMPDNADRGAGDRPASIRDAHKELTRERILDAAIDLLNAGELDALTIADVARIAGVTKWR